MRSVGVYRTVFPLPSETFIGQQARALREFRPVMISRDSLGALEISRLALSEMAMGRARSALFAFTGFPGLYGSSIRKEGISLVHAHFGPDGVYAMEIARSLNVPLIVTFHGFDCTVNRSSLLRSGKYSNLRFLLLERRLQDRASLFIAVSKFVESSLLARGYPKEKLMQHYIGVDINKFCPHEGRETRRYVLSVGRHTEKKGIDTLLRAFALIADKHIDVELVQVGDGSLTDELKKLAVSLGIEKRVLFLGVKSSEEVRVLMQRCTLFALPSQTAKNGDCEALGIVFNEASACGVPIVSTWHGGIPEAVIHGETGLLVEERDDRALAEAMDQILSDSSLGRSLGKRGREFVCDVFDLDAQTRKLEIIYGNTCK